ncbi:MAG: DNA-binding domain-containing protein [Bacteroidales bacterium]
MKYTIIKNPLSKGEKKNYIAKRVDPIRHDMEELVEKITADGSILKPTETNAVIYAYWETILNYIENGEEYADDFLSVQLNISGVFEDIKSRFDRVEHEVKVTFGTGIIVKEHARRTKPQFVELNLKQPVIKSVYDWQSDTSNQYLSPNNACELKGHNLKFYEEPIGQGVFIINAENQTEYAVESIKANLPRTISFRVPDLPKGHYIIEVRNTNRNRSCFRKGSTDFELIIQ